MHSSTSLVTALVIASTVVATPLNKTKERNTQFSIQQISNPGYKGFHTTGQAALAKTYAKYAKYGAVAPVDVSRAVSAAAAESSGTVSADPEIYDSEYLSPVSIGTPAQVLNLHFDTGSADLWVFSSETAEAEVDGQSLYNPSKSSTSELFEEQTWSMNYADGSSSSGDAYFDRVEIGGVSFADQVVGSAQTVSTTFTRDSACSGVVGLAFKILNSIQPTQQSTFFENVQSTLASPVFTADLQYDSPGTYDFGFIDSTKYTGPITYVPVNTENGLWEFTTSGYAIGNDSYVTTSVNAIADTGTTLLLLPQDMVTAYWAAVPGSQYSTQDGAWIFPCSSTLPSFTFGIGSYRGILPGKYINYKQLDYFDCYGGIQANDGLSYSMFGDILLKSQFVVFDGGNVQIGFASKTLSEDA